TGAQLIVPDEADRIETASATGAFGTHSDQLVIRISGAFFFGSVGAVTAALDRIEDAPTAVILDLSDVPFLDVTAAKSITDFAVKAAKRGAKITVRGARPSVAATLNAIHAP
ncbi:MAG TPA: sodium-independent anion transporter, partial [Hyphomicrobium sp.]|nr:sodium-independent anion transporter [Hyphomicrobium sp.]